MGRPLIIAELGTGWKPFKPQTLVDAAKAARDCGADVVKVQYYDAELLAQRRGCATSKLRPWALAGSEGCLGHKVLAKIKADIPLGVTVFHWARLASLLRDITPLFLKTATQEYQGASLASGLCSELLVQGHSMLFVSFPIPTVPHVGNYFSTQPITWMACVPHYPALPVDYNPYLRYPHGQYTRALHNVPGRLGLSDHTVDGVAAALWLKEFPNLFAIEKHFCYTESLRGKTPDSGPWSLSRRDFRDFVKTVRGSR